MITYATISCTSSGKIVIDAMGLIMKALLGKNEFISFYHIVHVLGIVYIHMVTLSKAYWIIGHRNYLQ